MPNSFQNARMPSNRQPATNLCSCPCPYRVCISLLMPRPTYLLFSSVDSFPSLLAAS